MTGKWLINMGKISPPKWDCGTPSKWPFYGLYMGVILTTYESWDGPLSKERGVYEIEGFHI